MTEELIVQLGRMDPARLGVIARTSAMQFKETAKRADQIGAELGVNYLLEGSVRASGSRIRIAVQLINAQSERQLWSDQYERDAKDLLTLQREVAEAITRQITTSLGDRHFKRAVELNPNYEAAVRFYSSYLSDMGRHDEALLWARRARDLNPVSPNAWWNLGLVHYFARRYDDAITQFRETLDLDPAFGPAHVMLGRTYVAMGLPDRAVEELERAKGLMGLRPDVITPYAYVLAKAGRRREAPAALDELRRISKPRDPSPFRVAYVHIGLGETERAFEELPKAVEARDWQMSMLKVEPTFDGLRSDPRFAALLRQVGFAQ